MQQIYKNCDMSRHQFVIAAYKEAQMRFPKLNEFPNLIFIPDRGGKIKRILFFFSLLKNADHIIWHSLFFTTRKYLYFLYFFKSLQKKSTWIEWGADLYSWEINNPNRKQKILNKIGKTVRERFQNIGLIFPIDEIVYRQKYGESHKFYYTPMPNPMKEPTGLLDFIDQNRPQNQTSGRKYLIQVAHNSFFFNNHIKLLNYLEHFKNEDMHLLLPLTYGVSGINGMFGGKQYLNAVKSYAKRRFKEKACLMTRNVPFEQYVRLLWQVDCAVFDFERPCALGNIRILLYMGKKVYLPAGTPFYNFFIEHGIKVYDTNRIPDMTFEEFIAPPEDSNLEWIRDYMNNDSCIKHWQEMFDAIAEDDKESI